MCGSCQGRLMEAGKILCPMCKREVPVAPTFRGAEGVPCAHAYPENPAPCANHPHGENAFEPEIQREVHSNPKWWSADLGGGDGPRFEVTTTPAVGQAPIVQGTVYAGPPPVVSPPKVGATKVSVNEKGDFVIRAVVAPPGPVAPPIEVAPAEIAEKSAEPERTEAAPKRAPRKRKKKAEDVDVDEWTP